MQKAEKGEPYLMRNCVKVTMKKLGRAVCEAVHRILSVNLILWLVELFNVSTMKIFMEVMQKTVANPCGNLSDLEMWFTFVKSWYLIGRYISRR